MSQSAKPEQKYPDDWAERRDAVLERDGFRCVKCGSVLPLKTLHIDHIVPINDGGDHSLSNLQTLCSECHATKHGRQVCALCTLLGKYRYSVVCDRGATAIMVCDEHRERIRDYASTNAQTVRDSRYSEAVCVNCLIKCRGKYWLAAPYQEMDCYWLCRDCRSQLTVADPEYHHENGTV